MEINKSRNVSLVPLNKNILCLLNVLQFFKVVVSGGRETLQSYMALFYASECTRDRKCPAVCSRHGNPEMQPTSQLRGRLLLIYINILEADLRKVQFYATYIIIKHSLVSKHWFEAALHHLPHPHNKQSKKKREKFLWNFSSPQAPLVKNWFIIIRIFGLTRIMQTAARMTMDAKMHVYSLQTQQFQWF